MAEAKMSEAEETEFVRDALLKFQAGYDRDETNITEAYEDLRFLAAKGDEQWDAELASERRQDQRPVLTINRLGTFHAQVANDIRAGKPAISVVPVDDKADVETAKIRAGMIRYIENRSDAKYAYASGAESQVACGIGHWKVVREYAAATTFNQELRIMPVEDSVAVIWDPEAVLPTREDAQWCFEPVDMGKDAFKAKYPDARKSDFSTLGYDAPSTWVSDDHVRVARMWVKKPVKRTLALLPGGSVVDITEPTGAETPEEFQMRVMDAQMQVMMAQQAGHPSARIERRESYKICSYLMTAGEILEKAEWPGMYFPIVPVLGKEIKFGREVVRFGIVRHARDPQKLYNYMRSAQAEATALQPKAPWLATVDNIQGYEAMWQTANSANHPVLLYKPDPKNNNVLPQRVAPPMASTGWSEQVASAAQELKDVTGIYDASLGNKSNETSGVAIRTREQQGDTATLNYGECFALAIGHTGRILNDLIPHIYDTERTVRILGEDGEMTVMPINQQPVSDGMQPMGPTQGYNPHDMTLGSYDIVLKSGPGFTTRREEARAMMGEFIKAVPQAAPLIIDLFAAMQDWPMADKIKERLETMLPPQLQAMEAAKRGEPPPPPPPPTPEQQVAMAEAQAKGATADASVEMKKIDLEIHRVDLSKAEVALATAIAAATAPEATGEGEGGEEKKPAAKAGGNMEGLEARLEAIAEMVAEMHLTNLGIGQEPEGPPEMPPEMMEQPING
jgi:hypothetical protein